MIDWARLRPYNSTVHRSFEELCYHIARLRYGDLGVFTSIDDSGGGDGVEFYLTFPSGEQWGWQAKWYFPSPRFSDDRKRSIRGSLVRACEQHPELTHWFLCMPTNLTPDRKGEQAWFDNTLPDDIPAGRIVELAHWGDSSFNSWLIRLVAE